jgi:hypothetical protein
MKKIALVISLFAIIFAFTVNTVSAQKVTSADKVKTEKSSVSKESHGKSCCSKSEAKSSGCAKDAKSGACAKEGEAKSGCAKSCSKAEGKSCCNKGEAKTEVAPVPKKN